MKKNKLRPIAFLASSLLWGGLCQAQESINANGGNATGTGGSVAYSIGQVVYTTNTGSAGSVAQGVQQSYTILSVGIKNETALAMSLSVFPNPTTDVLSLTIADFNADKLNYQLTDLQGKVISEKLIEGNSTQISMTALTVAVYFLNITQNNQIVKSFKIIKN
jgi:Secretion system C-terminal sorting domain